MIGSKFKSRVGSLIAMVTLEQNLIRTEKRLRDQVKLLVGIKNVNLTNNSVSHRHSKYPLFMEPIDC